MARRSAARRLAPRRPVPLGADAERARMLAAEDGRVPWRRWSPSSGPEGLPGIVDALHGVRLDLALDGGDAVRGRRDRVVVEYHAATPTSSYLAAGVELPGADDSPPCLLDIQFAKRAAEDIVISLTLVAGFGTGPAAVDLAVTLSLLAMAADADGANGSRSPSIRSAWEALGPGWPDDVTVLCAERPGSGTWWLVSDGSSEAGALTVTTASTREGVACTLRQHLAVDPGEARTIRLRLTRGAEPRPPVGPDAAATLGTRAGESDAYVASLLPGVRADGLARDTSGLLAELATAPTAAAAGAGGATTAEAASDAVMSAVALAIADPATARERLLACVEDRHSLPGTGAVEPPLEAWAALRIHEMGEVLTGRRDHAFLERTFQALLDDYSRWVDRLDAVGRNALQGGLLGLDGTVSSAAGAAWMGCYSVWMLSLAIELARDDPTYQDVTVTFLDMSLAMIVALDDLGGSGVGMWDEAGGVLQDVVRTPDGEVARIPGRSMVGLVPLLAVALIPREALGRLPDVAVRLNWSMRHQDALVGSVVRQPRRGGWSGDALVSLVPGDRRSRALGHLDTKRDALSATMTCLLLDMIDRVRAFDAHGLPASVGDALAARLADDPSAPAWATLLVRAMQRSRHRN